MHSGTAADATAATTTVHSLSPALLLLLLVVVVVVTAAAALIVLAFLELVRDFSVRSYLSIRLCIVSYRIFSSLFTCCSPFDCIYQSIRLFIVWYRIYSSLFTRYSDLVVRLLRPRPPTDTATPILLLRWFDGMDS